MDFLHWRFLSVVLCCCNCISYKWEVSDQQVKNSLNEKFVFSKSLELLIFAALFERKKLHLVDKTFYLMYMSKNFRAYQFRINFWKSTLNPFVPNASFLYPLNTSENRKVFWCFQVVEKGCIGNEWVNVMTINYSDWNVYDFSFASGDVIVHSSSFINWNGFHDLTSTWSKFLMSEAVTQRSSVKKMFLKIPQIHTKTSVPESLFLIT